MIFRSNWNYTRRCIDIKFNSNAIYKSHGDGNFEKHDFKSIGENVTFEKGVMVFHPENIEIGNNVYIGHNTILKGYYKNMMTIDNHTWIGQNCFIHSAGGITIGKGVGIGPMVKLLTSQHKGDDIKIPVLYTELNLNEVVLEDGCDIGIGSIILPGVIVGEGSIVGAGSIVTKNVEPYSVVAGVPARFLKKRG
ncbi:MAG: acyltransferase [ANME-2 cluster archaeon]|nr:acyltransferase [ANME-2 cluster archaeon]